MGLTTETIYIQLLDEGTRVSRPTQGVLLGKNLYRVLPTSDYDPNNERWEFLPGSVVRCRVENWSSGDILVAYELLEE